MTEARWLRCNQPEKMLRYLEERISDRKLRLFAVACCRQIWHLLADGRSRTAVEVAERYADGLATEEELGAARAAADAVAAESDYVYDVDKAPAVVASPKRTALLHAAGVAANHAPRGLLGMVLYCDCLRDIVGNPFRPVSVDPGWLTPAVVRLARRIYDERCFHRMAELADALKEAGCGNKDLLRHCRQPREHVRGCWVLDLLLGKE